MSYETDAIHGGVKVNNPLKGVNVPIELSTTFAQDDLNSFTDFMYSRGNNPTRYYLETLVAQLEGAKYGFATSSGMAATTMAFGLLKHGDHVITNSNVYGGTYRYVSKLLGLSNISYEMVKDFNNLTREEILSADAIFIETPSNPLLEVYDIQRITDITKDTDILVIVDNTFMTSYLQRPIELGADIVVYSGTKYYGGHSDVIGGFVITDNDELYDELKFLQNTYGGILSPFDSYLMQRGIKTLPLRMDKAQENAQKIAEFLEESDAVDKVYYPGLSNHPGHDLHFKQATGAGAVLSFLLNENYDMNIFTSELKIFDLAVSLGGVESLICHPSTMTHESYPIEIQREIGIDERLLRIAVGVENITDLLNDIKQALLKAKKEK